VERLHWSYAPQWSGFTIGGLGSRRVSPKAIKVLVHLLKKVVGESEGEGKALKGFGGTPTSYMHATKWLAYVELAKPLTLMI